MAFVNTRDTIGDQATVDGLVEHSLSELKEDGIGIVEAHACINNKGLQSLELPSVSQIKENAFSGCSNLEVVKLGGEGSSNSLTIFSGAFKACSNLKHLLIDRPAMATLDATFGLLGTKIALNEGAVYVPENLVSIYKADNTWGKYIIAKLADYPLSNFETITDSWSQIIANPNYATDYHIGDIKTLQLTDQTQIRMVIAAFDTDDKSDSSGKAKITWLCKKIAYSQPFHSSNGVYWENSSLRSWLNNTVYQTIPPELQAGIVSVKKQERYSGETNDKLWVPSQSEVGLGTSNQETLVYSALFSNDASRVRYNEITKDVWWLRTRSSTAGAYTQTVRANGTLNGRYSSETHGVIFGFCTD